jgi:NAD(P)-dependent dehydrogenase (short-subunit alcohol dehydrogenase family)
MGTNTRGAFFVAQEVGKRMIARSRGAAPGTFTGGRIVNVASMAGLRVLPPDRRVLHEQGRGDPHDPAMALEWGRFGINVNACARATSTPRSTTTTGRPRPARS